MGDPIFRIVGPNHNRLLRVVDEPDQRLGEVDRATASILRRHGFQVYTGPGRAARGWVVPGTDPDLKPRALRRS